MPGITFLGVPEGTAPNYWFYSVLVESKVYGKSRDKLMSAMIAAGIECRPVWLPNHMQKPYAGCRSYRIEKAPWFLSRVLNVPCSSALSEAEVVRVTSFIKRFGKT